MAQAYHLGVDMAEPYNVMGGFQDHEIWRGPNEKWNQVGVREGDWLRLRYMADGMHTIADPRDPNIIYYNGHFGDITRLDMRNREERYIQPYPPGPIGGGAMHDEYPLQLELAGPHVADQPRRALFRRQRAVQDDRPRRALVDHQPGSDHQRQVEAGGERRRDLERQHARRVPLHDHLDRREPARRRTSIWAGTDDGNVQVTRDGGKTWTNVAPNITGAPKFSWVSSISASKTDAGTAYISIDQHRLDDFAPYVFVTTDYGKTWRRISDGLHGLRPRREGGSEGTQPDLRRQRAGHLCVVRSRRDAGPTCGSACRRWRSSISSCTRVTTISSSPRMRAGSTSSTTSRRCSRLRPGELPASAPVLFPPMPAVRYTPASDTSVLGNRVWVAPNQTVRRHPQLLPA